MKFSHEYTSKMRCALCQATPAAPVDLLPKDETAQPIYVCHHHRSELQRRYSTPVAKQAQSLATRQAKARDSHYPALHALTKADAQLWSLQAQADLLNQAKLTTSRGKLYSATAVMRLYQAMAEAFDIDWQSLDAATLRQRVADEYGNQL